MSNVTRPVDFGNNATAFTSKQVYDMLSKLCTGEAINHWINTGVEHGQKYGDFVLVAKSHQVWRQLYQAVHHTDWHPTNGVDYTNRYHRHSSFLFY